MDHSQIKCTQRLSFHNKLGFSVMHPMNGKIPFDFHCKPLLTRYSNNVIDKVENPVYIK